MDISVEIRDQRLPLKMRLGGMRANASFRPGMLTMHLPTRLWLLPMLLSFLPLQRIRRSAMHRQR